MTQMDLSGWFGTPVHTSPEQPVADRDPKPENVSEPEAERLTIEQRWQAWSAAHAHVLAELLRLARAHLDRGVAYLSVKRLWEECRVSLAAEREGGYRLNNDFTAPAARWLLAQEPRLADLIKTRRTR